MIQGYMQLPVGSYTKKDSEKLRTRIPHIKQLVEDGLISNIIFIQLQQNRKSSPFYRAAVRYMKDYAVDLTIACSFRCQDFSVIFTIGDLRFLRQDTSDTAIDTLLTGFLIEYEKELGN